MSDRRRDAALDLLTEIRDEQRKNRESMDRLATSMFGLAKDMRRWFAAKTVQPALNLEPPAPPAAKVDAAWEAERQKMIKAEIERQAAEDKERWAS